MQATILTIGDEILIGQIVDTNSVSIAKYLNAAGAFDSDYVNRQSCLRTLSTLAFPR